MSESDQQCVALLYEHFVDFGFVVVPKELSASDREKLDRMFGDVLKVGANVFKRPSAFPRKASP